MPATITTVFGLTGFAEPAELDRLALAAVYQESAVAAGI
jgi:hypothetical protein